MGDRPNQANERTGRPVWRRSTILHFHVLCPSVGESVKPVRKVCEKRQRQGSQSSARHLEQRRPSLSLSHGDAPSRCQLNTFVRGIPELFENLGREDKPPCLGGYTQCGGCRCHSIDPCLAPPRARPVYEHKGKSPRGHCNRRSTGSSQRTERLPSRALEPPQRRRRPWENSPTPLSAQSRRDMLGQCWL